MRLLDLVAGEAVLDVQIQTEQGKRQLDRLRAFIRRLRRKSIHHVLMNELPVAARQRVSTISW
jgi:hypothetical protein